MHLSGYLHPPMLGLSSWCKCHCTRRQLWASGSCTLSARCLPASLSARQQKAFPVWMVSANGPGILSAAVCSGTGAARSWSQLNRIDFPARVRFQRYAIGDAPTEYFQHLASAPFPELAITSVREKPKPFQHWRESVAARQVIYSPAKSHCPASPRGNSAAIVTAALVIAEDPWTNPSSSFPFPFLPSLPLPMPRSHCPVSLWHLGTHANKHANKLHGPGSSSGWCSWSQVQSAISPPRSEKLTPEFDGRATKTSTALRKSLFSPSRGQVCVQNIAGGKRGALSPLQRVPWKGVLPINYLLCELLAQLQVISMRQGSDVCSHLSPQEDGEVSWWFPALCSVF